MTESIDPKKWAAFKKQAIKELGVAIDRIGTVAIGCEPWEVEVEATVRLVDSDVQASTSAVVRRDIYDDSRMPDEPSDV